MPTNENNDNTPPPDLPAIDRALARDDGGPAFPQSEGVEVGQDREPGMSLRDYFAGQALTGFLSSPLLDVRKPSSEVALTCYSLADALIVERKR